MSDDAGGPQIDCQDLVRRLWDDVRRATEAPSISLVPDLRAMPPMVHDADLHGLNAGEGLDPGARQEHLLALLNAMAERQDQLAAEIRLLREALKAEAERLAERDITLHRLLEARFDRATDPSMDPL